MGVGGEGSRSAVFCLLSFFRTGGVWGCGSGSGSGSVVSLVPGGFSGRVFSASSW